jgi:hypothetical protein
MTIASDREGRRIFMAITHGDNMGSASELSPVHHSLFFVTGLVDSQQQQLGSLTDSHYGNHNGHLVQ